MYLLFDIGGTKTRITVSKDLKSYVEPIKYDTPQSYTEGIERIMESASKLANGEKIIAGAGGIRGPLNDKKTGILSERILTEWVGKDIVSSLSKKGSCPIYLENDTAIVGLGEAHYGAGKNHGIVAYHTVSTGVGGVRIVEGEVDEASVGFEPGHQVIDIDRTLCPDCVSGELEDMISGTSLEKRFNKKPYDHPQDSKIWNELALWFSYGLKNTILYWSPDVIVLGGSMIIGDPRILLEDIKRYTKETLGELVPCPLIVDAVLKDEGGLYGAMALLRQNKNNKK